MRQIQADLLYKLLTNEGRAVPIKRGQIFQSSDFNLRMSLVTKGYVKRYSVNNDGTLSVQSIYGPGHYFPLTIAYKLLLDQEIYTGPEVIQYEAMTDTEIYGIDNRSFIAAVETDPRIYKELFRISGVRTRSNIQRLENSHLDSSVKKVAHQLVFFAREFGKKSGKQTLIQLPLTRQDIADVIGISRETVSTTMTDFTTKKLIKSIAGKKISIPDIKKLKDIAYS